MKITNSMLFDVNLTPLECYYKIIEEIKSTIPEESNYVIKIEFDNSTEIQFIHPLFLVYILNFYELLRTEKKYQSQDIRIILNIEELTSSVQKYIHTYLTQYIDCNVVLVVDSDFRDRQKVPFVFTDKKILLYTTQKENNLTLLKKKQYNFLPIIKISNNTFNEDFVDKDYWLINKATTKAEKISSYENRKIFYKSLQLETIEAGTYKNKSDKIWTDIFEIYLELTESGAYITNKFKEIFREIVENIQKHTKSNEITANGYISFYINRAKNLYEFIVSDDYQQGFLQKYYETIQEEIKIEKEGSIAWHNYNEILKDFKDEKYITILENIFNLKYVLSAQMERITKHFGMPLLLKIINQLEKLSVKKYNNSSLINLTIYLNKAELSFVVEYKNGIAVARQLPDNVVQGTYFYLSFPKALHLNNPAITTQKPLKLTSKHYKELLEEKSLMVHLKRFQYYFDIKYPNTLQSNKNAVIINYSDIQETSNFLRDLYSFAFLNSVQDILIVNYPIERNLDYLQILSETTNLSKICNIAFLNKDFPQVFLLGGNNYKEMCILNTMLSQTYNYNKRNFLGIFQKQDIINLTSNLFYTNQYNKQIFFPFELFLPNPKNNNELLYTLILDNFLELDGNYEKIHLDLKDDFHIKKFYYLKQVFENSQWIKLLAFDLAKTIKNKYSNFKNTIFVGIEKYSSSFIAELEYLLSTELFSYIVSDLDNESILEQFNNFKKLHSEYRYIFIRPSVFESKIDELTSGIENYEKYTFIQLTQGAVNLDDWIATYSKNLSDVLEKKSQCSRCFNDNKPLYTIDDDKYTIKDLYQTYDRHKHDNKIFQVLWKDAIYFPHIERNTNHYLYYIRTIQFFKNNKNSIKEYFKNLKFEKNEKIPVILTSAHNTNAEFIALINEIIFENDAIIHSFGLNNKEQSYFSIDYFVRNYKDKEQYYSFYFVDDSISSGESFKYVYSVLSGFFNDKFQAVFTLIDQTHNKDLQSINNFYDNQNFYSYIKMNIYPIKTGFENCYLCDRKKNFEKIAISSSLVTIKHTFQEKSKYLTKEDAGEIEYKPIKPISDLKNYLRMSSTEYIYQNMNEFEKIENIDEKIKQYYDDIVKKYFEKNYFNGRSITEEINKFLKVESKIAFLKSLAFPKIYFYKMVRENIHQYVYQEIREFTLHNKDNINIIPLLTVEDYQKLDEIDNIKDLVSYYKEKNRTNLNYFSFLLSLGSFLGINHILTYEVIRYYYNLTSEIKKEKNYKYKNLLDMYPLAVKQLTTYSTEKSKYFEKELAKFYKDFPFQYTRIFSRIFGLFVENTGNISINLQIFNKIVREDNIDIQVENFTNLLKKEVKQVVENIKIQSICVDIREDRKTPFMVDILNAYKEIQEDTNETKLYLGASIKKEIDYDTEIEIEHRDEKYHIWCNFYKDFTTYIRITNSNDNLTPMAIISIEHLNKDTNKHNQLIDHLKISRLVLAYQNTICQLFIKNNMLSAMRTKYNELIEKRIIEEKNKQISNSIHMINHTYRNYNKYSSFLMDIYSLDDKDALKENIDSLIKYSRGIELHSILGSLTKQKLEKYKEESNVKSKNETIYTINTQSKIFATCKSFLKECSRYIKTNPTISEDATYVLQLNEIEEFDIKYFDLCGISDDHIDSIFFELIFNIMKQNTIGSKISITIYKNIIYIENTGKKIEKERRENIFNNDETSSTYSFGLGLPTIRKTLSLFNIYIDCIDPSQKDYDCCFRIYKGE